MPLYKAAPLSADQLAKLALLQNRATLYEAAIVRPDGKRALLCYTNRKSRSNLLRIIRQSSDPVFAFTGDKPPGVILEPSPDLSWKLPSGAIVRFTGRTKRDVIIENTPLPFVVTLAKGT